MTKKNRKKLHGTVKRVIKTYHNGVEKAEIDITEADDLYREIRVDNEFMDESGHKAALKPGAEVDVVLEAESNATLKKPD